jgi:hypothetical protein
MNIADFYRDEAVRCQRRAQQSRSPERAKKWHGLADEYLRLALQLEEMDVPLAGTGVAISKAM